MKSLLVFVVLFGAHAFAAGSQVRLECYPTDPCLHVAGLSSRCVTRILVAGSANGSGTEVVHFRRPVLGSNFVLYPQQTEIQIRSSLDGVRFMDSTGDQWGLLKSTGGGQYLGRITLDQDFEFEVTCEDQALGFE